MIVRKDHSFLGIRPILFLCLLGISLLFSACTGSGKLQSEQTDKEGISATAAEPKSEVADVVLQTESGEYFENLMASAYSGYVTGLRENGAEGTIEDPAEETEGEEVLETVSAPDSQDMFDEPEGLEKEDFDGSEGEAEESEADGTESEKASDGNPPDEQMAQTDPAPAEAASSSEEAAQPSTADGQPEGSGGRSEVTYYGRERAAQEVSDQVSQLVMSETGGAAGYIASYQQEVIALVNELRTNAGLSPLVWDSGAQQVAGIRAAEIAGYANHLRPDGTPWYTVFAEYNIQPIPSGAGENIAGGQITPQEVMDTWLASTGHYANIMRPEFTGIGVGCYFDPDSDFKFHWVQTFVTR